MGRVRRPGAPQIELIVTVCDSAAGETCPVWPGAPITVHWGVDNPAAAPEDKIDEAFRFACHRPSARVNAFLALPFEDMDCATLKTRLDAISHI